MSLNVDIIQAVINGDETINNLVKNISVLDLTKEIEYLIKVSYKIGHRDARHDACDLINDLLPEDITSDYIMNIEQRCQL